MSVLDLCASSYSVDWSNLGRMESLRVMPPVPMTIRQAAKTQYIDGVLVPKGTLFYIPVRLQQTLLVQELIIGRRSASWTPGKKHGARMLKSCFFQYIAGRTTAYFSSFRFHPERWLDLPKSYHPVFSMLSFIAGPHACIGKTMAIIEMKAILA